MDRIRKSPVFDLSSVAANRIGNPLSSSDAINVSYSDDIFTDPAILSGVVLNGGCTIGMSSTAVRYLRLQSGVNWGPVEFREPSCHYLRCCLRITPHGLAFRFIRRMKFPMSAKWFRRVDGEEVGPHSADELKSLAQSGELLPEDLIWKDGLKDWVPARKVTGLFDGVRSVNPPPVPKSIPEVIIQTPGKQHVWTTAASKYASGCLGTFGVLSAMGIVSILTVVLVCGGGIVVLMNAFDKGEQDDNPVQRGADNPIADANDDEQTFGINEVAAVESVSLSVTKAAVGIVPLVSFIGDDTTSEKPALAITLRVENTDERKIVRRADNVFLARVVLKDDAGNVIRGVDYGAANPKGEMNEDLNPGEQTTHVEVFAIPPPATKFLVLTIDFEMFGSEGEATFQVSVDEIEGWTP